MTHDATAPSEWIVRFAPRVRAGGTVLDVAAGAGRHARLFLARGHAVTAIDRDVGRLAPHPALRAIAADLEDGSPWPLAGERFDAVVVTNYLWRPLLPALVEAVAPGGLLLYETFAEGNARFGKPSNPDFLLRPGELLELVRGRLVVAAYEHGETPAPRPAVVQRIAAVAA